MLLGSLTGDLVVSFQENNPGCEMALRTPCMFAAIACVGLLVHAMFKLRLE